jgi:hypothetical protein
MTRMKVAGLGALAALGLGLAEAPKANAAFIMTLEQVGPNVVATGSGSFDLADLTRVGTNVVPELSVDPSARFIITGLGNGDAYGATSGPSSFGSGNSTAESSESGGVVGLGVGDLLGVPTGYVSGAVFTSGATWDNTTLAALGVTDGSYVWTWGAGPDADSFTLQIGPASTGVPEPASLALLGAGVVGLGMIRRRRAQ